MKSIYRISVNVLHSGAIKKLLHVSYARSEDEARKNLEECEVKWNFVVLEEVKIKRDKNAH